MIMLDLHSHILPHVDDGAKTTGTAIEMLQKSYADGVETVVSTSHCYPENEEHILKFVTKRNEALTSLRENIASLDDCPEIIKGCELNMRTDVSDYDATHFLCIGETNYILVEMPSVPWKDWMIEAVYKMSINGYNPVMAHIDRYLAQDEQMLASLFELDVLYQLNTEAFLDKRMSAEISNMLLQHGRAHFLGTDMHNMTDRSPDMKAARDIIVKNYGQTYFDTFTENAKLLIAGADRSEIKDIRIQKKSFFSRFGKK